MILSVSRKLDLVLEQIDIEEAIERCSEFAVNVKKVTIGNSTGNHNLKTQMRLVMSALVASPDYSFLRSKLLKKFYGDLTVNDLDQVAETLIQAKAVEAQLVAGDIKYVLTKHIIDQYKKSKV